MNYTPLQKFFRMLHPNRREIKHLYIFAITSGLIALSLPLGIQSIINLIQGGEISASWILLVTIVILGFIFFRWIAGGANENNGRPSEGYFCKIRF
ncbi:MAG: hypothetical protein IPK25_12880 [Saprospiraceae bacterium]|nr:hypothetical protein [Saprospiraceae bacterium]